MMLNPMVTVPDPKTFQKDVKFAYIAIYI